jgi:peptide/nickel transport system substrate-binding protein
MASDNHSTENTERHLVEMVRNGKLTRRQLVTRAAALGIGATAVGQMLAACGGTSGGGGGASVSAAPSGSGIPAPVMGGTLTGVIPPSLTKMDPVTIYDQGGIVLVQQVCEYLIALDNDSALKPSLATEWSGNADGSVWTFKLREGVKFNDGSPFEAEDVVTTMDRVLDPKSGSGALAALGGILSPGKTVATDTYTVTFNLDKPFADFPFMVCQSSYNTCILSRNLKGAFIDSPVGTGPFMVKDYVDKQKCTMVKNPNYWGKDASGNQLPYLDGVNWVFIQDESAANLQLQSGAIDFQPQTVFQGSQALFSDPNLRVDVYRTSGIREVAFNMQKEPWKSAPQELRQAVAYCLDREALNQALFDGRATIGYDTFWDPAIFPGTPEVPEKRAQDYTKAKELLSTAGYPNGVDIELTYSKYLENPQFAQLIQQQCKPAGINVKLNFVPYDKFYAGSPTNTPWLNAPMVIVEWGSRPTPGVYAQAMLLPTSSWSSSHWDDQQFADTFNQYMATTDEAQRTELGTQLSQMQQDATPILVAYFISQLRTQKKDIYGIQGPGSFYCIMSEAFQAK